MAIVRMTSEKIRKKYPLTPERLAAIRAIRDEDIDFSDLPELPDEMLAKAVRVSAKQQTSITLPLSKDVVAGLKKLGKNWKMQTDKAMREWLVMRGLLRGIVKTL